MAVTSGTTPFSVRPPAPAVRPRAAARARAADGGPGAKWWAPLLGWSGQPDYIDAPPAGEAELQQKQPPRRFGVLTEDKARQLRARMMETESFHDAMYHSAIASRHASAIASRHSGFKTFQEPSLNGRPFQP